jgi:hypothetical protein
MRLPTILLGLIAASPVAAEQRGVETPNMFEFVSQSVQTGLKTDGVPRELAARLVIRNEDFVSQCLLCKATREALHVHSRLDQQPAGPGLDAKLITKLDSADATVRRAAFRDLIQGYIERGYALNNFNADQRKVLETELMREREQSMGVKKPEMAFCPSCDGVCCMSPPDDEVQWGEAKGGPLVSRLTCATKQPTLGQPLRVQLEVKNFSDKPAKYNSQQAKVNSSLTVKGPDGADIPYIGGSYQTAGGPTTLQPGESKTIYSDLDVAAQYLIEKPGKYTIQSKSRGGIPASNELVVEVQPGQLSEFQRLFASLQKATPKGWRIASYGGESIVFLNTPTNLKADATSVTLFISKEPTGGPKPMRGQPLPISLGETSLGQAWLIPQDARALERWADCEKVITDKLKPFKKTS